MFISLIVNALLGYNVYYVISDFVEDSYVYNLKHSVYVIVWPQSHTETLRSYLIKLDTTTGGFSHTLTVLPFMLLYRISCNSLYITT